MTKKQARKLRERLRSFRKQLGSVEVACWNSQNKIEKKLGENTNDPEHGALEAIGYALNRIRDELETAADNINYEIGALR